MIVILKKKYKKPSGNYIEAGKKFEVTNELGNDLIKNGIADYYSGDVRATIIKPIKKSKPEKEKIEKTIDKTEENN